MSYSERLKLMASLQERRVALVQEIRMINFNLRQLQKLDELECENDWL